MSVETAEMETDTNVDVEGSAEQGDNQKPESKVKSPSKKQGRPQSSPRQADASSQNEDAAAREGSRPAGSKESGEKQEGEPSYDAPDEKSREPEIEIPEKLSINDFHKKSVMELYDLGNSLGLRVGGTRSKHQLIFEIMSFYAKRGSFIDVEGIVEIAKEGFGFVRYPEFSFAPHADDIYVSPSLVRKAELRNGTKIKGKVRAPKDKQKFLSLEGILEIEGVTAEEWEMPDHFDTLTALNPRERIILENKKAQSVSPRAVDLIAPLGKGQRGLIAAPPRGGKTILLKEIASSIVANYPDVELIVLLLDERPEEVTDFKETVNAKVYSSTFDEPPERHTQVAEIVMERAKRLVELGKDVVILLDSLTRLARGYNGTIKGKGRVMSGGVDAKALQKPRKFFGAARNIEEGGSLTVLATALIETESRMDEVIFEEFKGTGNMEIHLDRELAQKRVWPAIHTAKSGTRKDELLYHPDEMKRVLVLRRQMAALPAGEAMEILVKHIRATTTNAELLLSGLSH